jgi:hypothetical protein
MDRYGAMAHCVGPRTEEVGLQFGLPFLHWAYFASREKRNALPFFLHGESIIGDRKSFTSRLPASVTRTSELLSVFIHVSFLRIGWSSSDDCYQRKASHGIERANRAATCFPSRALLRSSLTWQ